MRGLQRAGHLHPEPQHLVQRQRTVLADPRLEGTLPVVLHHQIRMAAVGFADLQDTHDVRVAGEPAHRALLPQEPLAVLSSSSAVSTFTATVRSSATWVHR